MLIVIGVLILALVLYSIQKGRKHNREAEEEAAQTAQDAVRVDIEEAIREACQAEAPVLRKIWHTQQSIHWLELCMAICGGICVLIGILQVTMLR